MAASFAEDGDEEVGGAVDDLRGIREAGSGADVAVDADDAADEVERAEVVAEDGELSQSAALGGGVTLFDGGGISGAASDDAGFVRRDDAGKIDERADCPGWEIVAAGCGKVWQGVACLGEKVFSNGTHLCRTVSRSEGDDYDGRTVHFSPRVSMSRLPLKCLLAWCLLCVACFGASSILRSRRSAPDDLEVDLGRSANGRVEFVRRLDLLGLPQRTAQVFGDEDLTELPGEGVKVEGVEFAVLAERLGLADSGYLIEAICSDRYDAPFPSEYIKTHRPILVLRINGLSLHAWAVKSGRDDPGPYFVAYDHFVPSFQVLSHPDHEQVPAQIVRLKVNVEEKVMATIAPRGPDAAQDKMVAASRIAQQNCLRCHNAGPFGGTKAGRSWMVLSGIAVKDQERFEAYVHAPTSVDGGATMPGNPQYDEETLRALAKYFGTFAIEDPTGKGVR